MRKFMVTLAVMLVVGLSVPFSPAQAQATRTWVSGVGDDANPCSRTAPCKTFAGAISKTAASGEINCIDPGGFGAVTITKSISIDCQSVTAGVLVSGTNGITVNPASTDMVTLRGLDIEGVGTGLVGISILNGAAIHVQNCSIHGFRGGNALGINLIPTAAAVTELYVDDTIISDNGTSSAGGGLAVTSSANSIEFVFLENVRFENNYAGVKLDGLSTTHAVRLTARNVTAVGSTSNAFVTSTDASHGLLFLTLVNTLAASNGGYGVLADGARSTVRLSGTTITGNTSGGVSATNSAVLESFKNNVIEANIGPDGTPITAFPGPGGTPLQ